MEQRQEKIVRENNPQFGASCISNLFFGWVIPMFRKAFKRDLTESDLYNVLPELEARTLGANIEKQWRKQLKQEKPSTLKVLQRLFCSEFLLYISLFLVVSLPIRIIQPLLLRQILSYYVPDQTDVSPIEANLCTFAIIFLIYINTIAIHTHVMGLQRLGVKVRVSICSLIYRKSLRLSKAAMNTTSTGQIINLLSNDIRMFDLFMLQTAPLVAAWPELIGDTLVLYFLFGYTAIIGILLILLFIPLQIYLGKQSAKYRLRVALRTDKRIALMDEIISGIQVIKMYNWEKPFVKLVEMARILEIKEIMRSTVVASIIGSFSSYISRSATFVSILTYVLTGNTPVAQYVFVLTLFYNNLSMTMANHLPNALKVFSATKISCKRVDTFLQIDEHDSSGKEFSPKEMMSYEKQIINTPVKIRLNNLCAKWNLNINDNVLNNITMDVQSRETIAIVGPVGSGKSSLLNVILSELPINDGTMNVSGRLSYASQEPWLFKGTIRQNILFGNEMDPKKYNEIVRICSLERDFGMLPYGDLSIIGDKGVMLSGGQKARINLARAVYKDADIYLLDDPLSAVDTHVGKQLVDVCINTYLANKCVILVTHQLQYLRNVDCIYVLDQGRIIASGDYQKLQTSTEQFAQLLNQRVNNEDEDTPTRKASIHKRKVADINEKEQKEVKEAMVQGKTKWTVYTSYFMGGGPFYFYMSVLALLILTQCLISGTDSFITFWVNLEQTVLATDLQVLAENITLTKEETYFFIPAEFFTRTNCTYIYTGIVLALIVFSIVRSVLFYRYCLYISMNLHNRMFAKLVNAPMHFFNNNPAGRVLNRFSKDIGSVDEMLPDCLLDTIAIGIHVIGVTTIISFINPWMVIPSITLLGLFYCYKLYYIRCSRSLKRLEGITRSPIFSHITASLQGLSTIRAMRAQDLLVAEFDKHQDLNSSAFYSFIGANRSFGMWLDINCATYVGVVTVANFLTATLGGNIGLVITQALALTGRLQWGIRQWSEVENHMTAVERVLEYTELETEEDNEVQPRTSWPENGRIEFKHVTMRYALEEDAILSNLSFVIQPMEKVGIVGRTGAGKSSTIAALFRLAFLEGEILIDGLDTKDVSLKTMRSKISIIPQDPFLFLGTLRKNLDPFDQYDDKILWEALDEVELKKLVTESPFGLNYPVSESGSNFSVGQRQLVCLARAITRSNKILVLDEATANVDPATDELIQKTIRRKFKNCTVLTIAHRLHTIMDSDKVLVMDAGTVVEYEHPHVLLQKTRGVFYNLVMQTGKGMADNLHAVAKQNYEKRLE